MTYSRLFAAAVLLGGLSLGTTANAATVTLDFEAFGQADILSNQIGGVHVSALSNSTASSPNNHAVIFDTGDQGGSNDDDLLAPFDDAATPTITELYDPGNILIISATKSFIDCSSGLTCDIADDEAKGGSISIVFDLARTVFQFDYFDIETDEERLRLISTATRV